MNKRGKTVVKPNEGITLIALVITIIVMLILVVVTIDIATEGGLIGKAKKAQNETYLKQEEEKELISDKMEQKIEEVVDGKIIGDKFKLENGKNISFKIKDCNEDIDFSDFKVSYYDEEKKREDYSNTIGLVGSTDGTGMEISTDYMDDNVKFLLVEYYTESEYVCYEYHPRVTDESRAIGVTEVGWYDVTDDVKKISSEEAIVFEDVKLGDNLSEADLELINAYLSKVFQFK